MPIDHANEGQVSHPYLLELTYNNSNWVLLRKGAVRDETNNPYLAPDMYFYE